MSLPRSDTAPQPTRLHGAHRLAAAVMVLLLGACAPLQDPAAGPPSVARAERLLSQNNPAGAAQVFERLAESNAPPDRVDFALRATRAWLVAGRSDDALRALGLSGTNLTPAQAFEVALLRVELALAGGRYADAWRQVAAIETPRTAPEAARLLRLRQQVGLRAAQPVEAVRAGLERDRVAATDTERAGARRELLVDLRQAIEGGLRVDPASSREPLVRGWLEIGQIVAGAARNPLGASAAIERWRGRYPGHPASTIPFSELVSAGNTATAGTGTGSIGLLLPITGRQGVAASLIRDGFQAGLSQLPPDQRPVVRIYDTGVQTVGAALQAAQADGMALLVGPLTREEVQSAAELHSGAAPLLLLNSLGTGSSPRGIYQFALSPEDEARQIARRALAAGQRRAIVFAPTGDWGSRVTSAFADELVRGGGQILSQSTYDSARGELTPMITRALAVDESRARHRRVQQVVGGDLVFEARRRGDVDLIFAAGQQSLALRQIHPQLRFFGAGDVPTYITSDGLDTDPAANRDLEGALFTDMPWVLEDSGPVAEIRTTTQGAWAPRGAKLSKLFAFGYDAAAIAVTLGGRQTAAPFAGVTGRLSVTSEGWVARDTEWGRVSEGTLRRLP